MDWRRRLAYRETDRYIRATTGRWPLSVSTDRLGLTAMRCAGMLARMAASGIDVDRSGSGDVAEVYPGATLRSWGCDTTGYRTARASRETLLVDLREKAPWLDFATFAELMVSSADAFDAVIAALCARAAALGLVERPPDEIVERARVEGWIALPTGPIGDLLQTTH
jgi:predicted nuclease with RNAse H fold